jgi:hypothetical protein
MKRMVFFAWQGARRRHSMAYGNDEQRRHTEKDAISCFDISGSGHKGPRRSCRLAQWWLGRPASAGV